MGDRYFLCNHTLLNVLFAGSFVQLISHLIDKVNTSMSCNFYIDNWNAVDLIYYSNLIVSVRIWLPFKQRNILVVIILVMLKSILHTLMHLLPALFIHRCTYIP